LERRDNWSAVDPFVYASGPLRHRQQPAYCGRNACSFGLHCKHSRGHEFRVSTRTLRDLERNRLAPRVDHGEIPPRVHNFLTDLGRSLSAPVKALERWVEEHFHEVEAARRAYEGGV
jgi:hypothetical protein